MLTNSPTLTTGRLKKRTKNVKKEGLGGKKPFTYLDWLLSQIFSHSLCQKSKVNVFLFTPS